MVNVNKLRGKMVEMQYTVEALAEEIGVDKSTLYRKFNDRGETFSIREASEIVKILGLSSSEAADIFFAHCVA